MTVEEYALRRDLAQMVLGEPVLAWWMQHTVDCPFHVGGPCHCVTDLWFSGLRRTVCVTTDLQTFIHPLH